MESKKAYLFVTCLVDNFFPQVAESVVCVLRRLGIEVEFVEGQTCCGQPAFNSGFWQDARTVAKRFLSVFDREKNGFIVCPSGSCTSMVRIFYRELFKERDKEYGSVVNVSKRVYEFSEYIVNVLKETDVGAFYRGRVAYHGSCHLIRELGIREEPIKLIRSVRGIDFVEMTNYDVCCGFGGTFSIKFPELSAAIVEDKIQSIVESRADTLVSTDMGCLMHIGGIISRRNLPIRVMHIAELLASR